MENLVRKIGTPVCRCGCHMNITDDLDYICLACGCRLTRDEYRRLEDDREEQTKKDALSFM